MSPNNRMNCNDVWLENDLFTLKYDTARGGFTSLSSKRDSLHTEYLLDPAEFTSMDIADAKWFGNIVTSYRVVGEQGWKNGNSAASQDIRSIHAEDKVLRVNYSGNSHQYNGISHFNLSMQYRLEADGFYWDINLSNSLDCSIEFSSITVPLLFNQIFRKDSKYKYEQNVLRHTFISGEGSYIYWARSNGVAPFLVMMPCDKTSLAQLEWDDRINAKVDQENGSPFGHYSTFNESWEGLVSATIHGGGESLVLAPGESVGYQFKFAWADSFADIGKLTYENGQVDIEVLPGLVVPINSKATVLLRSKKQIHELVASHADQTEISYEGEREGSYHIYTLIFHNLGANEITIHYGEGERCQLQFFCIDQLSQLIDSHASFIAEKQFETDASDPCYHGLLMWDMTLKSRINASKNPYHDNWWAGGSDEVGLVSGLFLSEKNVYRPVEQELKVLQAYLTDFVEARLTEQPGYRVHRMVPWFTMFEPWAGYGADDVWRAFNYVHVINTYYNMYRIQKVYSYSYLDPAHDYLNKAYLYTEAMFNYWMFPEGVGATEYGNMGELTIALELADALAAEGMNDAEQWVREKVASKASFFTGSEYPFGSEMAYDSTAYEAVYAYAKSARDHHTMKKAVMAAYANRGHQPHWYYYNTDLRQHGETYWNVSYMTHLGGWVMYDYTLHEGKLDYELIKSAYASYLAGWSLINSGYWNDDPENIGGSCWVLHTGWKDSDHIVDGKPPLIKKAWQLSGESGLGYFAGLKMASAVIVNHPILGVYGFGCDVEVADHQWTIKPNDGLSMRVFDTINEWNIEVNCGAITELQVDVVNQTIQLHMEQNIQLESDVVVTLHGNQWKLVQA